MEATRQSSLVDRMIRAAMLDEHLYEEVEHDQSDLSELRARG